MISPEDLDQWQQDTWTYLSSKPELLEALQDPDRLWNQDETSVELGCEKQVYIGMNKFKISYIIFSMFWLSEVVRSCIM